LSYTARMPYAIEESVENIREAIELNVESLIEDGLPIPAAH